MSGRNPGDAVSGLEAQVVGSGMFFEALPICPAGGTYTLGGDTIPAMGTLYMSCSRSGSDGHEPDRLLDW